MSDTALQTLEHSEIVPMDVSNAGLIAAVASLDLSRLTDDDKLKYLGLLCKWTNLNPLSNPFVIISIKGKLTLYATKGCAEQLRQIHNVSIKITERTIDNGVYIVRAVATKNGREDESIGAVAIYDKMPPDDRANAIMKAETKAKRRVTLSICGLGFMPDESELETIKHVGEKVDTALKTETAADRVRLLNEGLEKEKSIDIESTAAASPQPDSGSQPPSEQTTSAANIAQPSGESKKDAAVSLPKTGELPLSGSTGQPPAVATDSALPASLLGPDGKLNDATCDALAKAFAVHDTPQVAQAKKGCWNYLISLKKVKPGQGLSDISEDVAKFILGLRPGQPNTGAEFIKRVKAWADKQK